MVEVTGCSLIEWEKNTYPRGAMKVQIPRSVFSFECLTHEDYVLLVLEQQGCVCVCVGGRLGAT